MTNEQRAALEQAAHEFSKDWDYPPGWAATGKSFALFGAEWMEQNRWVPVTERLPENPCTCLVTVGKTVYEAQFINGEFVDYYRDGIVKFRGATAWCPWPAPYSQPKAENNE